MSLALSCSIGKAVTWPFTVHRAGVVVNLTGAKLWLMAKLNAGDVDADAALALTELAGIAIVSAAAGTIAMTASSVQTAPLSDLVAYPCELQVQLGSADPFIPDGGRGTLTTEQAIVRAP